MNSKINSPSVKLEKILYFLKEVFPNYPYSEIKDTIYFEQLLDEFPDIDIEEELKAFCAWTLDQPKVEDLSFRCFFRSWIRSCRVKYT